ncbi:electron transfer flavoprotein subunit alpha/FixB family protein [Salibacterium salarium]|uniref:Electron transfer flavoprotein subunit alpha/FixB family protein n=1 Tax=Salibacterium salarium TaxID=284579 RepID=A0A3R9WT12_9BACI|nr:electron transfer flavoprotein subunit alpha/FixB family protein [Salibacterium salarium]RSL33001.1 electron transfer flavoprotein subunit alpha/FixB family protein [Salibacterium salarium]
MAKKILVLGEIKDNSLRNVSFEAITAAKKAADGGEVVGVLFGENLDEHAQNMIQYGADRILLVEREELAQYTTDAYSQAFLQVYEQEKPEGIVLAHTSSGKDLAPRLAAKLNTGLVSDVVAIEEGHENPVFIRPIYSGKAFEKKTIKDGLVFLTIRPNNIAALENDLSRTGDVTAIDIELKDLRTIIKEVVKKTAGGVDLAEANIIVAGGRGVKSAEGFTPLEELADVLGAAVGASRGACDAEYCEYSLQIGQTGKVVTPDLYIAAGISGAIQHLAGMSNAKVIVAINKDPEAPIFDVADYGIVGDLFEIIPMLTEECKKVTT